MVSFLTDAAELASFPTDAAELVSFSADAASTLLLGPVRPTSAINVVEQNVLEQNIYLYTSSIINQQTNTIHTCYLLRYTRGWRIVLTKASRNKLTCLGGGGMNNSSLSVCFGTFLIMLSLVHLAPVA